MAEFFGRWGVKIGAGIIGSYILAMLVLHERASEAAAWVASEQTRAVESSAPMASLLGGGVELERGLALLDGSTAIDAGDGIAWLAPAGRDLRLVEHDAGPDVLPRSITTTIIPAAQEARVSLDEFRGRVWIAFQMSSGRALADGRNGERNAWGMGWGVPEGGYDAFYERWLVPSIERGFVRFLIHQPYGEDRIGPMDFDARVDAIERGFTAPLGFGAMLRRCAREHPDVRFIVYLGALDEPNLVGLAAGERNRGYLDRLRRSLIDVLDAGNADVAFDHRATFEVDSIEEHAATLVESLIAPREGWIEAVPFRRHEHHHAANVITSERFWQRSRPMDDERGAGFADSSWAAPSQWLTGRLIRWDMLSGRGADWAGQVGPVLADGDEYAGSLMYYEGTLEELWEAATQ